LQPCASTYVNLVVKEQDKTMNASAGTLSRRYVKVALPTGHAGIGDALRQAFRMDAEIRCLPRFRDLLERLD